MKQEHKEVTQKLVGLINNFLSDCNKTLDPSKFQGNEQLFVSIAMSPGTMITATMIEKLSVFFGIDLEELIQGFNLALRHSIQMYREEHCKAEDAH